MLHLQHYLGLICFPVQQHVRYAYPGHEHTLRGASDNAQAAGGPPVTVLMRSCICSTSSLSASRHVMPSTLVLSDSSSRYTSRRRHQKT